MRRTEHNYRLAKSQRKSPSLPEGLLWREFRSGRNWLKFRRQHPIGPYVLDFYCAAAKCAFEIDGIAHDMGDRPSRDEVRNGWLAEHAIRVVRIPAREVLSDPNGIAERMVRLCEGIIAGDA